MARFRAIIGGLIRRSPPVRRLDAAFAREVAAREVAVAALRQEIATLREEVRMLRSALDGQVAAVGTRVDATEVRLDLVIDEATRRNEADVAQLRRELAGRPRPSTGEPTR